MKHLKVYEDDLESEISDLKGLGILDDMHGWWIQTNSAVGVIYYAIYESDEKHAANRLFEEILSNSEEVEGFQDLIDFYKRGMKRNTGLERMQISVWEMKPRDTITKPRFTKIETPSIPEIHRLGKTLFSDFDMAMEKKPTHRMLNRPAAIDNRISRSIG